MLSNVSNLLVFPVNKPGMAVDVVVGEFSGIYLRTIDDFGYSIPAHY